MANYKKFEKIFLAKNDQNYMKRGEKYFLENFWKIFHLKNFWGLRKISQKIKIFHFCWNNTKVGKYEETFFILKYKMYHHLITCEITSYTVPKLPRHTLRGSKNCPSGHSNKSPGHPNKPLGDLYAMHSLVIQSKTPMAPKHPQVTWKCV